VSGQGRSDGPEAGRPATGRDLGDGARFAELWRTNDRQLRDELVTAHLGLARQLARRFTGRGEPYDDLAQVAALAVVKAVDRFDPERRVEFSTFATRTILGELKRHFRDRGWVVRAPRRIQELYLALGPAVASLSQELGRSPTVAELAATTGASEEAVLEAMEAGRGYRPASIDAPDQPSGGLEAALGSDEADFGAVDDRSMLGAALAGLSERDRVIVRLRFVDGLTQSEIAARVGISQMQVSRLLAASLARMRASLAEGS
jgi:RNA polymerase sigma-B factor